MTCDSGKGARPNFRNVQQVPKLTHTAAVCHASDFWSPLGMPADGTIFPRPEPCGQVVAEGAGRGGTPARRGGVRGTRGGYPGPLAAVARPLAAERHPDLCARSSATPGHRGRLRVRYLGFAAIQKRLAQAIGHMKGPTSRSGTERTNSVHPSPAGSAMAWPHRGARAARTCQESRLRR